MAHALYIDNSITMYQIEYQQFVDRRLIAQCYAILEAGHSITEAECNRITEAANSIGQG